MLASDTAVAALRSDLARQPEGADFGDSTNLWLGYVSILARAVRGEAPLRALLRALIGSLGDAGADDRRALDRGLVRDAYRALRAAKVDEFSSITRDIAARMEDAGALSLADTALQQLLSIHLADSAISDEERGRVISHRARLARQAGDTDLARDRYEEVARLARATRSRELAARAANGFAILAMVRGNLPESGKWFARAARAADESGVAELSRTAHHGCLIVAAKRGAFEEALPHGWLAFRFSTGDPQLEAEALSNLGGVLADMGLLEPALAAFEAALRRNPPARITIPALGGAILMSARLGDASRTRALYSRLLRRAEEGAHQYELADALVDAARALHVVGDRAAAARVQMRALEMATAGGFHELQFRAERALEEAAGATTTAPKLSRATRTICERVEQLESTDLLELART